MPDTRHSDPRLTVTRDDTIAVVTFDRPERRNAFDLAMWRGLRTIMQDLSADDALRCVVLRGAGEKAFCAGADIGAFAAERGTDALEAVYAHVLDTSMQSIRLCQHPVVAMIMGYCLGGGAGIATMCDFRVGGEGIRMGITARNLGVWYPYAEIDPIITLAGSGVASEMLIEGRIFNGREAYEKGLLSRVVPDGAITRRRSAGCAGRCRSPGRRKRRPATSLGRRISRTPAGRSWRRSGRCSADGSVFESAPR
jgi:enoyl-CoA hydratase/carnithine racemase